MSLIKKGERLARALADAIETADLETCAEGQHFTEAVELLRTGTLQASEITRSPISNSNNWKVAIEACKDAKFSQLVAALLDIEPIISWNALPELYGESLDPDQAFGMVVGNWASPLSAPNYGFGLLLMGPNTTYPTHHHAAREVYFILSGTAHWKRGDEPWIQRAPGSVIYHPSNVPHATHTDEDPLLAVAMWISDLDSKLILTNGASPDRVEETGNYLTC